MNKVQIYLTRRNLLTLLAKLDRNKETPGASFCTLIKQDDKHPRFKQVGPPVMVTAVEDADYYIDRKPGEIHPEEQKALYGNVQ